MEIQIIKTTCALALTAVLASASTPSPSQPAEQCTSVSYTLHSYNGPIHITDACLTAFTHTGDMMTIHARDAGDGIFKGDFEVWP